MVRVAGVLTGDDGKTYDLAFDVHGVIVDPPPPPDPTGTACFLGTSGDNFAAFAGQLTSKKISAMSTWNDSSEAHVNQWTLDGGMADWSGVLDNAVGGVWPQEGDSWATAGAGGYEARWTECLEVMLGKWGSRDPKNLCIRFAHECNGDFSEYYVNSGNKQNYINAFRRFTALQRSIIPGSKAVWGMNDGSSTGFNFTTAYPGDDVVDIVGIDTYNAWDWVNTQGELDDKAIANDGYGGPQGIEAWRLFAKSHGKPLCLPEWGNSGDPNAGGGGGDSPLYMQWMRTYFATYGGWGSGQVAYANYFNAEFGSGQFQLYPTTVQPQAWSKYKQIF